MVLKIMILKNNSLDFISLYKTILCLCTLCFVTGSYKADEYLHDISEVTQGSLLIHKENGRYQSLPLLDTQVELKVSGLIARATVKQFFQNKSKEYIEASYIFPLPEDSAVDHMSLVIGERRIIGEIKEKMAAKKIYKQAKRLGKKAALLEQTRANIFTTKVANIAPDEVVQVTIEYQQVIQYEAGEFSLRFPSTITPRYHPARQKINENFQFDSESEWQAGGQRSDRA
jgi:Ca-activated chloride channel family protein